MRWKKANKPAPMVAIGRLMTPFTYEAQIFTCGPGLAMTRLDEYLKAMGREGWKLHTIDRVDPMSFFCVWEKLNHGEGKA